jgi:tetratricopeptide (TPR) repeat protein
MKKTIRVLAIYATLALMPVFANVIELKAQTPAASPAQGQCTPENKLAWYTEFRATFKTDQNRAYDLAQKYLACPSEAGEESIRNYLKNTFVAVIDKARRPPRVAELVYDKKDYAKAFELGKQVLADEPDNVKVLLDLAYAGYLAAGSKVDTFNADSLVYAKKAIQLLQGGAVPDSWAPYANKDEALSYLNNTVGVLTIQKNPSEALPYLIKAAQFDGKLKKQPITYGNIGDAYQTGPYEKLSADYKAKFEGKDETPESKLALENINQVIDRIIDAYARAVALAGSDAAIQNHKKAWMDTLTTWYKYRHNQSDVGLTDLIASVMTKPLPPQPTPLTTLPATSPTTSTPTNGSTTAGPGTAVPAANKTNTNSAETANTKATAKPKIRNNHRRP